MTVTVTQSTMVAAGESTTTHAPRHSAGVKKGFSTVVEATAALDDNSILVYGKIPVDANVTSLRFASDDLGTTGTINLGLYPGNIAVANLVDSAAADEDCLATAIDVNAAAVAFTEVRNEVANIDSTGKTAWELAGLSAKPTYAEFWVCGTLAAATTAAGTTAIDITFI